MEIYREPEVFGPYRLKAKIAQGGMAEVFLATSTQRQFDGRFLALKKLLPHLNSNRAFVDLLIHEAKIGVLLNHPSIASVYDLGSQKSEFFIAIEYVHGKSLDRILDKIRNHSAPKLPLEVSTYIVLEVIRALSFAHQLKDSKGRDLSIVHRDISPGNILVGYRGEVKVVDFGIATAESRLHHSFSQQAMGKLAYMAPEQAVNDPVTRASDLYSLGVVYYEMLTNQLPFQAENANALLRKVLDGSATDLKLTGPSIDQELRDIVTQSLDKSARKRFQSGPEMYAKIVEHFKRKMDIDFSTRATRDYYKKKLSEYMRTLFESEMIAELELIQKSLKEDVIPEEMKITAPQNLPTMPEANDDATIATADHTDEATRHYPLSAEEREKLLQGKSVREAVQKKSAASNDFDGAENSNVFRLATIPEYDLALEDSSVRRISVKEKLESSSLGRDQRETLKLQMPSQEITSQQELDEFEENTFSGKKLGKDVEQTLVRDKILKDFEEIKKEDIAVSSPPPPAIDPANKFQPKTDPRTRVNRQTLSRPKEPSPALNWAISIVAAIAIGAILFFAIEWFNSEGRSFFQSRKKLLPTQKIHLTLLAEGSTGALQDFSNESQIRLSALFNKEYQRYTGDSRPLLDFGSSNAELLIRGISHQENALELMKTPQVFQFLSEVKSPRPRDSDAVIYLYAFPYESGGAQNMNFPTEFPGDRPSGLGIVFVPSNANLFLDTSLALARELAFLYGAEDARDSMTGLPLNPQGLVDPAQSPLYPQFKADLMGRAIAISPLQKRNIQKWEDLQIGPYTAYELGWITKDQLKEKIKSQATD